MSTRKRIWMNYHGESACPYHRILLPGRHCASEVEKYGWDIDIGEGIPPGYDVYFIHGLLNELALVNIGKIRKTAKFVWSTDDDWLTIPDWNPAKPNDLALGIYGILKDLADYIVVSTPHLATTFDSVKEKVLCAPNMLELDLFPVVPYTETKDGRRDYQFNVELPVRVAWVGGHTHKEDIEVMTEPLIKLMEKYDPSKVVLIFNGMMPPPKLMMKYLYRGLFHQPSVPFASYQKILNSIKPHVYLAPMAPIDFNLSKSNLRVMEGWAMNAAVVASDWGEYRCIDNGKDGRIVGNSDEWFSVLDRLVRDHEYRLNLAIQGYDRVQREYSWANPRCRKSWLNVFGTILDIPELKS